MLTRWLSVLVLGGLSLAFFANTWMRRSGPRPEAAADAASLPNYGPAPELVNTVWLNTQPEGQALRLADLRGRVVLLEMWTFGCSNCQHVIPSLKAWHAAYAEQGLVIIGNHFPEFAHEADLAQLRQAVARLGLPYAVAQDNDGLTWRAYHNRYWPTLYLIDKRGDIRYTHIGEGAYDETEAALRTLLAERDS
jgi:thiol-disulfide isomerase/thioredoxin